MNDPFQQVNNLHDQALNLFNSEQYNTTRLEIRKVVHFGFFINS